MINDLKKDAEERMNKSLDSLEHGFVPDVRIHRF